ncbi:MAG: hypothetical protein IPQ24_07335 [Anaeromyxobacter sp.]|nr:hypothetical protein [Anaeromyxobacter sp.]
MDHRQGPLHRPRQRQRRHRGGRRPARQGALLRGRGHGAAKLWAGPGWNTGLPGDNGAGGDSLASLYGTDWAFAAKLESRLGDQLRLRAVASWLQDWEADKYSPFLTGAPDAARGADHSVSLSTRFRGVNATLDAVYTPSRWSG